MRKRRNMLQNWGCIMLAGMVWSGTTGTVQAAAQQNEECRRNRIRSTAVWVCALIERSSITVNISEEN